MINLHLDEIEKRWGKFEQIGEARVNCCQGVIPHYFVKEKKPFYSNMIFNPISLKEHEKDFNGDNLNEYDCEIPQFLKEIYSITNGLELFWHSLGILGHFCDSFYDMGPYTPSTYPEAPLQYFDMFRDSYERKYKKEYSVDDYDKFEYVFFGRMGDNFLTFKPGEEKVYVITEGLNGDLIKVYDSFQECWDHYFYGLMERYDDNGKKKDPTDRFKEYPYYYNRTFYDF